MTKSLFLIAASAFLLTGCGTTVTASSPRTVAIQSSDGMQGALDAATAECRKYGREARWVSGGVQGFGIVGPQAYTFDCL